MPVQCFNHVAKMWEDGVVPWQQDAKKTRCLFCDLLNCHWQSLGFVSGLLHLSEKCTLYICTSFEWGRCHFTYTQPLIYIETLRWVGATSNWAGKQKKTWEGWYPAIGDGKLRQGPFPQSPYRHPWDPSDRGKTRSLSLMWHLGFCKMTWWLDGSIHWKPQIWGIMRDISSGSYVPYDKDREIPLRESGPESLRLGIWGMQRTCYSNVTSESATAESLHCWRRCGVLVCDFKVSWPESTKLIAWSRWVFFWKTWVIAIVSGRPSLGLRPRIFSFTAWVIWDLQCSTYPEGVL